MSGTYQRPEWQQPFYDSNNWKQCRRAYAKSVGGLCERCLEQGKYTPGEIVHHIEPLTAKNINDPNVSLNWNNLMLVCRDCHGAVHRQRRWKVDEYGRVTPPR